MTELEHPGYAADAGPRTVAQRVARLLALVLVVGAGGAIAVACSKFMGRETALCMILGLLVLAPIAARWWTQRFDLFEPAVIIAGVYFLYFVIGPLARIATDDLTFLGRDFATDYLQALAAVTVAVCAMWSGYALPIGPAPVRGHPAPSRATSLSVGYGRRYAVALAVVAVLAMVLWARIAGRSMLTFLLPGISRASDSAEGGPDIPYLFLAIEWFIPATTVLMAMGGLRGRLARAAVIGAVTIVYISIGFRYRIVMLWLATAIVAYLRTGRRPRLRYLVVPGVLLFLFAGWLAQARAFFRSGGAAGRLTFDLRNSVLEALADTRIFDTFGAVLDVVPRFERHAGILPFVYPFLLPIPRLLWPGKPLPTFLATVNASIGTAESAGAGPAVPHFGEYYVAFGWPGIVVGSFLFGAANKWLWRWYRAAPHDPWRQAIFALNACMIFQAIIRGYLSQIIQEWCFVVLPAIVLATLSRHRGRTAAAREVEPAVHA